MRRLGVAAALVLAAAPALAAENVELVREGRRLADSVCVRCHAIDRSLVSPIEAAPAFRTLAEDPALTEQAIRTLLRTSHNTMPDIILETGQRDAIAAYIKSLARP
jgi:mono/diheme cytochrome c family protein